MVVVCPQRVYERLRPELDEPRERLCRRYEREYEDLLAERTQLEDEIDCLERQLERKESQLDAVVARNDRIMEARTESYRRRIEDRDDGDDFLWTGRRQESGLLAAVRNWLR
jgi:predicted  nucleic acid-binding Zn-ribbon protein